MLFISLRVIVRPILWYLPSITFQSILGEVSPCLYWSTWWLKWRVYWQQEAVWWMRAWVGRCRVSAGTGSGSCLLIQLQRKGGKEGMGKVSFTIIIRFSLSEFKCSHRGLPPPPPQRLEVLHGQCPETLFLTIAAFQWIFFSIWKFVASSF